VGPNIALLTGLADATGGKLQADPAQVFRDERTWVANSYPLTPALLALAALLLLADIAIRRIGLLRRKPEVEPTKEPAPVPAPVRPMPRTAPTVVMTREEEQRLLSRAPRIADDSAVAHGENVLNRRASRGDHVLGRSALRDEDDDPFPRVVKLPPRGRSREQDE
jgi:hypothetical protein